MDILESWHYIALLGAVIAIFAFLMPKQAKASSQRSSSNDQFEQMELSLGQFMDNMELQHEELVKVLSTSINQLKDENRQQRDVVSSLEKKCSVLEEQLSTLSHAYVALETKLQFIKPTDLQKSSTDAASQVISDASTNKNELNVNSIHSRYEQLFELYEAGKSIEFIAKKIGKNKGEVQLIIELAKQEEKVQHG